MKKGTFAPQVVSFLAIAGILVLMFIGSNYSQMFADGSGDDVRESADSTTNTQKEDTLNKSLKPEPIQPLSCPNQFTGQLSTTSELLSQGYLITDIQRTGQDYVTMVIFNHPDHPFLPSHLLIFINENYMQAPIYQATHHHIEFEPYPDTNLAKAAPLEKSTDLNGNNYMEAHYTGFNGGNGIQSAWVCILEFDPDPTTPYLRELGYIISDWDS